MLNPDEIGEKGQARFKELCADAGLVCNQSDRDRTGWDFLVEFPFEAVATGSTKLETRETPLSCHVQVKTLWEKNDRFKMRLSSAERLAKELKPAFLYILKVNSSLQFSGAYLVHILDEPLGKILKRLRKEDSRGRSMPNKKTISMSASRDGIVVAPTGRALRDAFSAPAGKDMHAYAAKKYAQLKTLGFEERPYTSEMTLQIGKNEEIVDVFLGLKRDVPVTYLRTEHTRFGIAMPLRELTDKKGTITIEPSPADTCTITVRGDPLSPAAVFRGNVFFPPPNLKFPPKQRKVLLRTDLFSLILCADKLTVESDPRPSWLSPATWASYWRFAQVMAKGEGTIQIVSDTHPINLTIPVPGQISALDETQCAYLTRLSEQVEFLFRFINVVDDQRVRIESLVENAVKIHTAYRAIKSDRPLTFSFESDAPSSSSDVQLRFEVIYADHFDMGNVAIGYCGLMYIMGAPSNGKIEWHSENFTLKKVARLHSMPDDFETMLEGAQKETGCQGLIRANLNAPLPAVP